MLLLPVAIKMAEILNGIKYVDEIRKISLSNDTVAIITSEIRDDEIEQFISTFKENQKFTI